jgi:MFS family permease
MNPTARLVLVTAFTVLLFNSGVRFSIGLVLKPMAEDLAWTRTSLSLAVTTFMVLSAIALPFAGRLVDRFGAGKVLGISVVLMSAGTIAMSFVRTPFDALLFYGIVVALGSAGTSIAPIGVLVSRWFPQRIGLANSVAISGMGVGQLLIILVLSAFLPELGWRAAFIALGAANVVFVLPLVWFTARKTPATTQSLEQEPAQSSPDQDALKSAVVWRSRYFWWLLSTYAICGFHDFLVATHIVAFALDEGLSAAVSGNMLAFMGLTGLAGVLVTGFFTDRYGPVWPTIVCFLLRIVLFSALLLTREPVFIVSAALVFGMTFWITAPLTLVFVKQHFGLARLGTIAGIVTMVHHSAGGFGAYLGAVNYDATGNYDLAYVAALVSSVVAIACSWQLRAQTTRLAQPSAD